MQLYKTTDGKMFGHTKLLDFLQEHGARIDSRPVLEVTAGAIRAALADPEAAGLTPEDVEFLKEELAAERLYEADDDDDAIVDYYTVL